MESLEGKVKTLIFEDILQRRRHRGFSIIEVLVTVAIVASISLVAILKFEPNDFRKVRAVAHDVALSLQQARLKALETQRQVQVRYDPKSRLLTGGATPLELPSDVLLVQQGSSVPTELAVLVTPLGTSKGARWALKRGSVTVLLELSWLTGRISIE